MANQPFLYHDGEIWRWWACHNVNAGNKAIFVGGGPSLNKIDTNLLSGPGKTVYGINNTYPKVRPDIWMGMDDPRCYHRHVMLESFPKIMRYGYEHKKFHGRELKDFPNTIFVHMLKQENKTSLFHSIDPKAEHFVWNKNTFEIMLQTIMFMGHKEIYLAGHDFSNENGDYHHGQVLQDEYQKWNANLYSALDRFMRWFVPTAEVGGIKVYSMSPESPINDYMDYKSIEDLNQEIADELPELGPLYHCRDVDESTSKVCSEEYKELLRHEHRTSTWGVTAQKMIPKITEVADKHGATKILDYGAGSGGFKANCPDKYEVVEYDPGIPEKDKIPFPEDFVICIDVMEHIEPELLDGVIKDLKRVVRKAGYFSISTIPARRILKDGRNAHLIVEDAGWWITKLAEHFNIASVDITKISVEVEVTKKASS